MHYVGCVLFGMGLLAYIAALFTIGSVQAEIFSDVGTAIMLITCTVLLLGLTYQKSAAKRSETEKE